MWIRLIKYHLCIYRSQRNEEVAVSQENLIIPPDYYDAVTVPKPAVPSHRQLVNTESQTTFAATNDRPATRQDSSIQTIHPRLLRQESVCGIACNCELVCQLDLLHICPVFGVYYFTTNKYLVEVQR